MCRRATWCSSRSRSPGPRRRAKDLFIGVNALDYSGYPDCRPEFIGGFQDLARVATKIGSQGGTVTVHAPLSTSRNRKSRRKRRGLGSRPGKAGPATIRCPMAGPAGMRQLPPAQGGFAEAGLIDGTRYGA
jgi:7-cyano-7-deazaguanine synthase